MKVSIIDAGEMGTAMAVQLAIAGHDVTLMIQPYDYAHLELLLCLQRIYTNHKGKRENDLHLGGIELPENIKFTDDFECVRNSDAVFLAVPSRFLFSVYLKIREQLATSKKTTLVLLSKGSDIKSGQAWGLRLAEDLLKENDSQNFVVLTGYTPAHYFANAHRTLFSYAASAASHDMNAIKKIYRLFKKTRLGIIGTKDLVGVSWGGLLKNSYAIGYGLLNGCGGGEYAHKYLELAHLEMKCFLEYFGAAERSWDSPAVKGDFYLTSQGQIDWKSRNVAFGEFLSKYQKFSDINIYVDKHTVEGYEAMNALWKIALDAKLHTEILFSIHSIACYGASPCILLDLVKAI